MQHFFDTFRFRQHKQTQSYTLPPYPPPRTPPEHFDGGDGGGWGGGKGGRGWVGSKMKEGRDGGEEKCLGERGGGV